MANPESKFVITAEDRATATLKKVSAEFGGLGASATRAAAMLTTFGGALSLGAVAAAFKSTADRMDEFSKAAQRAQMPTEDFSRLAYAGKLADVSMQDLQTAMGRLAKAQGDAIDGTGEQADAFRMLGISVKNADGTLRDTSDVFLEFADKFEKYKGSPEVMAAGMKLFGRSFQNLIPLLKDGSKGLKDAARESDELGFTLGDRAGKQAEAFNDNLTRLGLAGRGVAQIISGEMMGPAVTFTDQLVDLAKAALNADGGIRDMARDGTFKEWAQDAAIGVAVLAESLTAVAKMAATVVYAFGAVWADVKLALNAAHVVAGGWMFSSSRNALSDALDERNKTVESFNKRLDDLLHYNGTALSDALRAQFHPAAFSGALLAGSKPSGSRPRSGGGGGGAKDSDVDKYLRQLDEQIAKTADLTTYEKLLNDIEAGRLKGLTAGQFEALRAKAEAIDAAKDAAEAAKREAEFQDLLNKAKQREIELDAELVKKMEERANKWLDELDPMREFIRHIEDVDRVVAELQKRGWIFTPEQIAAMKELGNGMKKDVDEINAWAVQAAKNIQDALGQGLYDILSGNFDNIGKSFGNMLNRMLAEATAAQLSRALFGNDFAKGGGLGGLLGDGLKWLGNLFIPSHADGLDYVPYDGYIAKLHRGERVQTAAEARNAGPSIVINSTVAPTPGMNPAEIRALLDQRDAKLKADIGQGLRRGRYDWAMA
jgi:hypothetical protein